MIATLRRVLSSYRSKDAIRTWLLPLLISTVLVAVGQIVNPGFGSLHNIGNLLAIASILTIGAAGQTIVIISGNYGIDLAIGALMSMGAVIGSGILQGNNANVLITVLSILGLGAAFGLVNGMAVWKLKIPALVMTLAMGSVVNGFALAVSRGRPFGSASSFILAIGGTRFLGWVRLVFLIALVFVVIVELILRYTSVGKMLFMTGNNRTAARMVGIDTGSVVVLSFVLSGMLGALAGLFLFSTVGTAQLQMADDYTLLSVAAVVLGGTQLSGGKGSYVGTAFGAIVIVCLTNVLITIGIPEGMRLVVTGVVLIIILGAYSRQAKVRQ